MKVKINHKSELELYNLSTSVKGLTQKNASAGSLADKIGGLIFEVYIKGKTLFASGFWLAKTYLLINLLPKYNVSSPFPICHKRQRMNFDVCLVSG